MEELKKFLRDFLKEEEKKSIQAFRTSNLAGDFVYPIYNEDGVEIYYAPRIWLY